MQRRIASNSRSAIWIEWIVWNAAAGAALAVMILVLLVSLQWLDRVAPHPLAEPPPVAADAKDRTVLSGVGDAIEATGVNRPSG